MFHNEPHTDDWADNLTTTVSNAPLSQHSSCTCRAPAHFKLLTVFFSLEGGRGGV